MKTYSELMAIDSFEGRYNYLKMTKAVGEETFGWDRYLNQVFYTSPEWKRIRNEVIARDNGCDMGVTGYDIYKHAIVHHMNGVTKQQILDRDPDIFNKEYLITVSFKTHNAIHYGDESQIRDDIAMRSPNDTCPWKG